MTTYRLVAQPAADRDIEGAFAWYQNERAGLGLEFLDELRIAYGRIADGPLKYRELRSGIQRTLLRRFPYVIYFSVEQDISWSSSPCCTRTGIRSNGKGEEASPAMQRTGFAGRSSAGR